MFNVNDIVSYSINGVCRIVGIEEKNLTGVARNYMILKPLNGDKATYYVPTDNEKQLEKMKKVLSRAEIDELIDSMPDRKSIWIDNERDRKEHYRKIIAAGTRSDLIGMIKAIYFEKKAREEVGKKLHIADERFLKEAEKLLYNEFQYVLQLSEEEVMSYIFKRIEKKEAGL